LKQHTSQKAGPLSGLKVIELAGIGPGPFAAMSLSDMGAEVIRIDRIGAAPVHPDDFLVRGRRTITVNLKTPEGVAAVLRLIEAADGLIEGFRPGVMERLGLGPDVCLKRAPHLVYGRMTGWGQDGPYAQAAGHDLNYIALTGALWATGEADRPPTFAMNLLGDYGGGAMPLVVGMLAGLVQAKRTGRGDVIDAAICDGTNMLMTYIQSRRAMGLWLDERAANYLDGGTPWYGVYECADGKWISIAPIEQKFWDRLVMQIGCKADDFGDRADRGTWQATRRKLTDIFRAYPQAYWDARLAGTDACYAPVLSPAEARAHPHMAARDSFFDAPADQPRPAPRFDGQTVDEPDAPRAPDADTLAVLADAGFSRAEVKALLQAGAIHADTTKESL